MKFPIFSFYEKDVNNNALILWIDQKSNGIRLLLDNKIDNKRIRTNYYEYYSKFRYDKSVMFI